jgi:hypothetical protein
VASESELVTKEESEKDMEWGKRRVETNRRRDGGNERKRDCHVKEGMNVVYGEGL